ncbi:hypothetical protein CDAR_417431 [Caerostris darwini]|uniref:Uncharacterized protein n=1 Tax=Caerostris darwini TaxID=1538125 RepID=A0AAV4X7D6_9ARAC|nr:hypothetical protein CDAR_417431 [Caerostris darwini]
MKARAHYVVKRLLITHTQKEEASWGDGRAISRVIPVSALDPKPGGEPRLWTQNDFSVSIKRTLTMKPPRSPKVQHRNFSLWVNVSGRNRSTASEEQTHK